MNIVEGAFSIVIATKDKLIAVRDKYGFRPLCIGRLGGAVVSLTSTALSRRTWSGSMNDLPTYLFFTNAVVIGIPDSSE